MWKFLDKVDFMTLIGFLVTLIVLGLVWYLIDRFLPMPEIVKTVINIILVLVVIFMVLALFGVMSMPFKLS